MFDQTFYQAVTNAYLLMRLWVKELRVVIAAVMEWHKSHEKDEIDIVGVYDPDSEGKDKDIKRADDRSDEEFRLMDKELDCLYKIERVHWEQALSGHMMSKYKMGTQNQHGRRKRPRDQPAYQHMM